MYPVWARYFLCKPDAWIHPLGQNSILFSDTEYVFWKAHDAFQRRGEQRERAGIVTDSFFIISGSSSCTNLSFQGSLEVTMRPWTVQGTERNIQGVLHEECTEHGR